MRCTAFIQQRPRHLIVGKANCGLEIDLLGQQMDGFRRRCDHFGIAAATLRKITGAKQHFLSDPDIAHAAADGLDPARQIVAGVGRLRRHPLVDAAPDQFVGLPNPKRFGADQHIAFADLGHRDVLILQGFRPPGAMYQDSLHARSHPSSILFSKILSITKIIATVFSPR